MKKQNEFKKKGIMIYLKKNFPEVKIVDVIEYEQYGYDSGITIIAQIKDQKYCTSNYDAKGSDFMYNSEDMINSLKQGYEDIVVKGVMNEKFLLDQLVHKHITEPEICKKDYNDLSSSTTYQTLMNLYKLYPDPKDLLKHILDESSIKEPV